MLAAAHVIRTGKLPDGIPKLVQLIFGRGSESLGVFCGSCPPCGNRYKLPPGGQGSSGGGTAEETRKNRRCHGDEYLDRDRDERNTQQRQSKIAIPAASRTKEKKTKLQAASFGASADLPFRPSGRGLRRQYRPVTPVPRVGLFRLTSPSSSIFPASKTTRRGNLFDVAISETKHPASDAETARLTIAELRPGAAENDSRIGRGRFNLLFTPYTSVQLELR